MKKIVFAAMALLLILSLSVACAEGEIKLARSNTLLTAPRALPCSPSPCRAM